MKTPKAAAARRYLVLVGAGAISAILVAALLLLANNVAKERARRLEHYSDADADRFKQVIAAFQRLLERNPTPYELNMFKNRMDRGENISKVSEILTASEEYKRLNDTQINWFNTGQEGNVTYRQALLKMRRMYKKVFGTADIPEQHLAFLMHKYMSDYDLNDASAMALLRHIRSTDAAQLKGEQEVMVQESYALKRQVAKADPVLQLITSPLPYNPSSSFGSDPSSITRDGKDALDVQAYLQSLDEQNARIRTANANSNAKANANSNAKANANSNAKANANSNSKANSKANCSFQRRATNIAKNNKLHDDETTDGVDGGDNDRMMLMLLDEDGARQARDLLPLRPRPPVCIGGDTNKYFTPLAEQSALVGTMLGDVRRAQADAEKNAFRTVAGVR